MNRILRTCNSQEGGAPLRFASIAGFLGALFLGTLYYVSAELPAQAPGVAIEENEPPLDDPKLLAEAAKLKEAGKLLDQDVVRRRLRKPTPAPLKLPRPSQTPLSAPKVAQRAREAMVRIGWYYLCDHCDDWHLDLAGGFAIADGAATTCRHCIDPDEAPMREGYLVAVDSGGTLRAATAVLAADEAMDVAVVKIEGLTSPPLPLNDQVSPGEASFVYSDPMSVAGHFTVGHVNRFFWADPAAAKDPTSLAGARNLRLHVSNDWAPGSSGSAVFDACGNVIGQVAAIEHLMDEPLPSETPLDAEGEAPPPAKGKPAPKEKPAAEPAGDAEPADAPAERSSTAKPKSDAAPPEKTAPRGGEEGEQPRKGDERGILKDKDMEKLPPMEGAAFMILHEAVPARSIRLLVESMGKPAAELKTPAPPAEKAAPDRTPVGGAAR